VHLQKLRRVNCSTVDAAILQDAARFKMDFAGGLERTLHGPIKPSKYMYQKQNALSANNDAVITQCSMRHLYDAEPKDESLVEHAKGFERRRCGHHTLEKPLTTLECFKSVVDPKGSMTNKHRYVVGSQDPTVRAYLRKIPGVPMIYIKRSVMIMEPMAGASEDVRDREEKAKFKSGIKGARNLDSLKRPRAEIDDARDSLETVNKPPTSEDGPTQKKRKRGPSGPNPLSVKKKVNKPGNGQGPSSTAAAENIDSVKGGVLKPKRKRKHGSGKENGLDAGTTGKTASTVAV